MVDLFGEEVQEEAHDAFAKKWLRLVKPFGYYKKLKTLGRQDRGKLVNVVKVAYKKYSPEYSDRDIVSALDTVLKKKEMPYMIDIELALVAGKNKK